MPHEQNTGSARTLPWSNRSANLRLRPEFFHFLKKALISRFMTATGLLIKLGYDTAWTRQQVSYYKDPVLAGHVAGGGLPGRPS